MGLLNMYITTIFRSTTAFKLCSNATYWANVVYYQYSHISLPETDKGLIGKKKRRRRKIVGKKQVTI